MAVALALSASHIGLKRWLKTLLAGPGLLLRSRRPGLRVLMYHRVNPYPFECLGPVSRAISIRPETFERQLRYLAENGYRTSSLDEFSRMMRGERPLDRKAILITFDDGYEDNLRWAAPLLRRYGFTATVFVVSDFLGRSTGAVWPHGDPEPYGGFLSPDQLRELAAGGLEVGSHTSSHPLLTGLAPDALEAELGLSRARLEALLAERVVAIAYPGGDFDAATQSAASRGGYVLGFTTIPGINRPGGALTALARTEVSASDSFFVFRMKIAGALDFLSFKESPRMRAFIGAINRCLLPLAAAKPRDE